MLLAVGLVVNPLVGFNAPEKAKYGTDDQEQEEVQGQTQQEWTNAEIRRQAGHDDPENDQHRHDYEFDEEPHGMTYKQRTGRNTR